MANVKAANALSNDADISERLALAGRLGRAGRNGDRYIIRRDNTHFSATLSAHLFPRANLTMNLRWRHCYEIGKNERLNRHPRIVFGSFLKGDREVYFSDRTR